MAKTLEQLLQEMIGANESLAGSIGNQQNFTDVLKNAISSKFGGNEDLIKKQAEQAAAYFNAPSQAREKYQDIFDPFARERLATEYQQQQGQGLGVASELLKERRGSQAELLQAGVGGFQSYLQGQQAAASGAQQAYQTAYQKRQDELQQGLGKLETLMSSGAIATMGEKALKLLAQSTGYTYGQLLKIRDRVKRQLAQAEEDRRYELEYRKAQTARQYDLAGGGGTSYGGDSTVQTYAKAIAEGQMNIGNVPQKLRSQVLPLIQQYEQQAKKQYFSTAQNEGLKMLQSGQPWSDVFWKIANKYKNLEYDEIDQLLNANFWKQEGAYDVYRSERIRAKAPKPKKGAAGPGY